MVYSKVFISFRKSSVWWIVGNAYWSTQFAVNVPLYFGILNQLEREDLNLKFGNIMIPNITVRRTCGDLYNDENDGDDDENASPATEQTKTNALLIIIASSASICCLFCAATLCIIQLKLRKQWKDAMQIRNGLIVSIAIGEYFVYPQDPEISGHLINLPVQADVDNLRKLAEFLNFTFLTMDKKLKWTKQELLDFVENQIGSIFFDELGNARFDGLIVAISSHGLHNSILTSDYKAIRRTDIHRCISEKYPQIRVIPRIFLFDACDGTRDRKSTSKMDPVHSQSLDEMEVVEALKGSDDVVEALQMETEWTSRTKNPDYNLVVVHGSNDGFVSKMQGTEVGSYLTYFFAKAVRQRIERNERKGLSQILTDIQNVLHDKGKQLIRKEFFNDTEYLRIEVNQREHDWEIE